MVRSLASHQYFAGSSSGIHAMCASRGFHLSLKTDISRVIMSITEFVKLWDLAGTRSKGFTCQKSAFSCSLRARHWQCYALMTLYKSF